MYPFTASSSLCQACDTGQDALMLHAIGTRDPEPSASRPRQDSEVPIDGAEEGEAMDATNDDDAAMMAMMGMTGFGTTKVSLQTRTIDNGVILS